MLFFVYFVKRGKRGCVYTVARFGFDVFNILVSKKKNHQKILKSAERIVSWIVLSHLDCMRYRAASAEMKKIERMGRGYKAILIFFLRATHTNTMFENKERVFIGQKMK